MAARKKKSNARSPEAVAAIELAAISPKRAFNAAREVAKKLGDVPAAIDVLDAVADASVAKSTQWAAEAFRAARTIERRSGAELDVARCVAFAEKGALDPRDLLLALEAPAVTKKQRIALAVGAIAAGAAPTTEIIDALREGGVLAEALRGWLERNVALPTEIWIACKDVAGPVLSENVSFARALIEQASKAFDKVNALELLALLAPFVPGSELRQTAIRVANDEVTARSLELLACIIDGHEEPLSVIPNPEPDGEAGGASWDRQLVDPAIVEVLLAHDAKLRLPAGRADTYTFSLHQWAKRDLKEDTLERVGAHPFFSGVLLTSFLRSGSNGGEWLARAVDKPGLASVLDELGARIAKIPSTWTLGALDVHHAWLEGLLDPTVIEAIPAIASAVSTLDPATLFANQLRAGILDEWGWPAYDEALERIEASAEGYGPRPLHSGPFPYVVLHDDKKGRIIAVGPERIEIDRPYVHPEAKNGILRGALYCEGDVLACAWDGKGQWIETQGETFPMDAYGAFDISCDGAILAKGGTKVRRGEQLPRREDGRGAGRRAWFDGQTWFDVTQECILDVDGKDSARHHPIPPISTFDPTTGERTGVAIPRWMLDLMTTPSSRLVVHIQTSFICPVPKDAEASPLGAKDGFGGFALIAEKGSLVAHRIDGKSAPGLVNGVLVAGLMTFPERDGLYPLVGSGFDLGIALPDGTPLVPTKNGMGVEYWGGTRPLRLLWFHLLRPRDPKGSRALANISVEKARAIVEAANAPKQDPEVVMDYGNMQAVMVASPKKTEASDALRAAIERELPEVTHPRLRKGIAALAQVAVRQAEVIARMRSRLPSEAIAGASKLVNADARAIARLLEHEMHWWIEKLGKSLGLQIQQVAHYLFESDDRAPRTPAPTIFPWDLLVTRLGELVYRLRAPGTPSPARVEIARLLQLWSDTAFAKNAARMRLVVLRLPKSEATAAIDREHPDRLVVFEDRFFLRHLRPDGDRLIVRAIHASLDGSFRLPPGAELLESTPAETRFDAEALKRLVDLPPVAFDRKIAERIASKTGLALPSATLLWAAAYDPWLANEATREALGIDRKSLAVAEAELEGKRLSPIYEETLPDDPDVADRIAEAYARVTDRR